MTGGVVIQLVIGVAAVWCITAAVMMGQRRDDRRHREYQIRLLERRSRVLEDFLWRRLRARECNRAMTIAANRNIEPDDDAGYATVDLFVSMN